MRIKDLKPGHIYWCRNPGKKTTLLIYDRLRSEFFNEVFMRAPYCGNTTVKAEQVIREFDPGERGAEMALNGSGEFLRLHLIGRVAGLILKRAEDEGAIEHWGR